MAGEFVGVDYLRSVWPGFVAIKVNTCIGLVLLGVSLWIQMKTLNSNRGRSLRRAAQGLSLIVAVLGLLSLSEIIFGWNLRIDQAIHPETIKEAFGSVRPGLMSPITALNFLLLGLSLAFVDSTADRGRFWSSQLLSFVAVLLSLFSLMDVMLAPRNFHTHIALQTVVTFCVLSFAVLCVRPECGLSVLLRSPSSREAMLRTFLDRSREKSWKRYWALRYGVSVPLVAVALILTYLLRTYSGVTSTFFNVLSGGHVGNPGCWSRPGHFL